VSLSNRHEALINVLSGLSSLVPSLLIDFLIFHFEFVILTISSVPSPPLGERSGVRGLAFKSLTDSLIR
jgi:hypothetical protein